MHEWFRAFTLLFALGSVTAMSQDYAVRLSPLPTVVSGTLSPLVIALGENVVLEKNIEAESLTVRGEPVPGETTGRRKFYGTYRRDILELQITLKGRPQPVDLKLKLPTARLLSLKDGELKMRLSDDSAAVKLDGAPVPFSEGKLLTIKVDASPAWATRVHVMEIASRYKSIWRIYNLRVVAKQPRVAVAPMVELRIAPEISWLKSEVTDTINGTSAVITSEVNTGFEAEGILWPKGRLSPFLSLRESRVVLVIPPNKSMEPIVFGIPKVRLGMRARPFVDIPLFLSAALAGEKEIFLNAKSTTELEPESVLFFGLEARAYYEPLQLRALRAGVLVVADGWMGAQGTGYSAKAGVGYHAGLQAYVPLTASLELTLGAVYSRRNHNSNLVDQAVQVFRGSLGVAWTI